MHSYARYSSAEELAASVTQNGKYVCPECTPTRKAGHQKRADLTITIEPEGTLYFCHHCEVNGMVRKEIPQSQFRRPQPKPVTEIPTPLNNQNNLIIQFFQSRSVDVSGIELNERVITGRKYFSKVQAEVDAIGFVYGDPMQPEAIKWRPCNSAFKTFTQDGAAKSFYGIHQMERDADQITIVEGEADVVALESVGIKAWSVPNGAPLKVSGGMVDPEEDKKFAYVWEAWEELDSAKKVIFATDADKQGEALKQELARRIGLEKCWEVSFPDETKDANDVLEKKGSDALKNAINAAKPMPLRGIYDVNCYFEEVEKLYKDGMPDTESTGFKTLDSIMRMQEGMVYITTGYPGSGKSEWIDQIMVNMAENLGWKWAVASFENPPDYHLTKMIEKHTGKPFFEGRSQRVSREELEDSRKFLLDHFIFLEQKDGSMATIQQIIKKIKLAIARFGIRGAVIDPYNYINMNQYESEHKGIETMLSELSAFARAHRVAIFFVAHPQKIWPDQNGEYPVPTGSHISGSGGWWAKADIGVTVQRKEHQVEIHVWKVRFKWLGKLGMVPLRYNVINGQYFDMKDESFVDKSKWVRSDGSSWDDLDGVPF